MSIQTSKLEQKTSEGKAFSKSNHWIYKQTSKAVFIGIVILALACWLVPVSQMNKPLFGQALSSAFIIFLVAINYLITPKR